MLQFFRTNSSNNLFLLIAYAALLQLHLWIDPALLDIRPGGSLVTQDIFNWIYSWMQPTGWLSRLLALALVLGQALYFARTIQQYKVLVPANWLVALFYILFASFMPAFQYFSPELLSISLLLLAFRMLFSTYYEDGADGSIFDSGLLIGLVSLLYPPYALLLIFAILSLVILRPLRFREAMVYVAGFLLPWFLSGVVYLMMDRLPLYIRHISDLPTELFLIQLKFTITEMVLLGIAGILLISSFLIGQFKMINSLIHSRKFHQMVVILLLVAVCSTVLLSGPRLEPFIIFVLPMSFFTAYLVNNFAWHKSVEGAHLLIVLLLLATQFSILQ